jgi:hypothetical protein
MGKYDVFMRHLAVFLISGWFNWFSILGDNRADRLIPNPMGLM